ncbi:MAG: GNAT family N-acetyltransferase [Acidobacteriota bacterium]|nr:GNAT family N-acetyltransferase [Acidobacteriota bacterium]
MLVVRGVLRGEVAAAAAIINEGTLAPGAEHPEREDEYWAAVEEVRARRGDVLVAVDDDVVVGVCQVIVFRHFQHTGGWCAELESVYVRSDRRGQRIGAAMLDVAESLARAAGCYRVQLTSRNVRVDAHRFYLAHGYEQSSQGFRKSLL